MVPDEDVRERLKEKVEEADLALTFKVREGKTSQWAAATINYADALSALAAEEEEPDAFTCYQQAITAYEGALQIYTAQNHAGEWLTATCSLVRTLRAYGLREGGDMGFLRLNRAEKLVKDALRIVDATGNRPAYAALCIELADVYRALADTDRTGKRRRHLEQTIATYAEAGQIFKAKEQFENWAACLVGQAMAWRKIGEIAAKGSSEPLYHAAELFKSALSFYNHESHPADWGYIHFEYGRTFLQIASTLQGERRQDAASAAVDALRIAVQSASALNLADFRLKLHNEFSMALFFLAQCPQTQNSTALLEEAIHLLQKTADSCHEQENPVEFARTQGNLGKSLMTLAAYVNGRQSQACRMQAIDALRKSISPVLAREWRQEWLSNLVELGTAFHLTANNEETERRFAFYHEAAEVYREILRHTANADEAELRARLHSWLGLTLAYLGEKNNTKKGERYLKEAELAFRLALNTYHEKGDIAEYARLQSNIGNLFYTMARRADDPKAAFYLRDARQAMTQAINSLTAESFPAEWSTAQWNYGLILKHTLLRGLSEQADEDHETAAHAFRCALAVHPADHNPLEHIEIKRALASLLLIQVQNPPTAKDNIQIQQALELFTQIHDWATQNGHTDIAEQTLIDIDEIQQSIAVYRPRVFFKWLARFFPR